ncbi:MAG TPA: zinc ribbon domain-containing protein [Dehalococcoidia bacterium]|nr:zinc ribbon domain-containing protein [Dehalococcoidia bacterium]
MPLYEYYCEKCDTVFEALRPLRDSDAPAPCPTCGRDAARIMPTTFASMSFNQGYAQRVPFHHRPIRSAADKPKTIAPVRSKARKGSRRKSGKGEG